MIGNKNHTQNSDNKDISTVTSSQDNSVEGIDVQLENVDIASESSADFTSDEVSLKEKGRGAFKNNQGKFTVRKLANALPKNIFLLIVRFLISAVLLGISFLPQLSQTVQLILSILAFVVANIDIAIQGVLDVFQKDITSGSLIFFIASTCIMAAGFHIEACASPFLFSAGKAVFEYFHRNYISDIYSFMELSGKQVCSKIRGSEKSNRIKNLIGELKSGGFSDIRALKKSYIIYFIAIVCVAVIFCCIPPLIDGMKFDKWIYRGAVLVSICAFFDFPAILTLKYADVARKMVSDGIYLSSVEDLRTSYLLTSIIFGKSGVLTEGKLQIVNIQSDILTNEQLLFLAAVAETFSEHKIAVAVKEEFGESLDRSLISWHAEEPGMGCAVMLNNTYLVSIGNAEFMEKLNVKGPFNPSSLTYAFVAVGHTCVGRIDLKDEMRANAPEAIASIKKMNVANIAIMTGDNTLSASNFGRNVGIAEIYADYQPSDKIERLRYIISTLEPDDRIAYVSNGVQDSELLGMVDLGIVLDDARNQDVPLPEVLIGSTDVDKIPTLIKAAKGIQSTLRLIIPAAIAISVVCAFLSAFGYMFLWLSTVLGILVQFLFMPQKCFLSRKDKINTNGAES